MKRKILAITASAGLAVSSALIFSSPASAALVTRCVGEGGAVTVPGDLVVPANQVCTLDGTTIQGNVRVAKGADLVMNDVTVEGNVAAAENAYLEAVGSTVSGQVALRGAFGAYIDGSSVAGNVATRTTATVDQAGFVLTNDAELGGNLIADAGEVLLEASAVEGNVSSVGSYYTDVYESFIDGKVTVTGNELGGVFCAVAIDGVSSFADNAGVLQLGADGPNTSCEGTSYWGDDVSVTGNTGGVYVDNNIVNGDLALTGNDPVAQVGANNRVRGDVSGESEEWAGTADPQARTMARAEKPASRKDALESKIADRGSDAEAEAEKVGPADL
ncbi:hypothetical protein [Auraticoccus monumenti]|uniref:Polymer-forming protein n=1 Tax=Auraticoccus monumenti TaxID=675864 RepID=A0A1G6UW03_9ACTN|nr:hypothetical protein [Auraticoccus monumenti]SDD45444.1 hypothetical protein SAMN04489747_0979 [Auraticoccus monumenti]